MVPRASLTLRLLVPVAFAASGAFAACSNSGGGSAASTPEVDAGADAAVCEAYAPPASFDPTSPTVSFTGGVMPVFAASCAFSSCHGSTTAPQGGLFLGSDPARVYAALVGVSASEYPTMERVKPSDAASSYLLYRLDGNACTLSGCTTPECYEIMPQGNPQPIAEATRLTIRGWIAQGAVSDIPDSGPVDASSDSSTEGGSGGAGDGGDAGAGDAGDATMTDDASDQ